ncbi:MAG TPA: ECF transporter S component [Amnibacterium sp.]|jgi:energy-coupling factor transport system substrate-specific component|uniref:ECF transporter S component n=1 Tax=Amnibacterium sp. TaxID=1872496 RepID=UPI002F937BFE
MTVLDRPRTTWRVVDIVVASVIAAACSVVFIAWGVAYQGPATLLTPLLPGLQGLVNGPWLFAGVLAGLIVRRPGAAIYAELVAAVIEALVGNQWGVTTLISGLAQGLGAELVFAVFLYRGFGPGVAFLAGAGAGLGETVVDLLLYYPGSKPVFVVVYAISTMLSGAVFGFLSLLLVRALARTGALARFAAGRDAKRVG